MKLDLQTADEKLKGITEREIALKSELETVKIVDCLQL